MASLAGEKGSGRRARFEEWYLGGTRKDEADVRRWIGLDPIVITGAAGSRFIVNTEAIHRGMPPEAKDRSVLQLVYAIAPSTAWATPYEAVRPMGFDGHPIAKLHGAPAYAARLLFPNLVSS